MNKAAEILTDWINENETYLEILKDRANMQKYWVEHGDAEQIRYYTTKYQDTQHEVDELTEGIRECKQALAKVEEGDNQ